MVGTGVGTRIDPAQRPFRFSVQARHAGSGREWAELARRVEGSGYAALVTPDHLDECLSPLVALVAAADATTGLRVGTLVLNNDLRHPSLLAREAATVDLLTDGRLELGLGAGHARSEYARNGLTFDTPAVRLDRLAESVAVLRRLLSGEAVSAQGRHYQLEGERCWPRPVQDRIPILVGGGGPRVLALAARLADTVGFTGLVPAADGGPGSLPAGFGPAAVDAQVGVVRGEAGARLGDIELHALVQAVTITDRPQRTAEDLARTWASGIEAADVLASPFVLVGTVDSLVDRLLADRQRWGFSHYTVRPEAMAAVSPVVAALAGR